MTLLHIDPTADTPPYEQVRRQLIEQIHTGQLPAKTRLPAVRRLAADLGIAPGTVARAYKELEADGYLATRGRNGTVIASFSTGEDTEVDRLTTQYVTAMRELGLDTDTIIATVRRALPYEPLSGRDDG